jgi:hypothetical protein
MEKHTPLICNEGHATSEESSNHPFNPQNIENIEGVPVYRYHACNQDGSGWRFMFDLGSNESGGWSLDEQVFLAYTSEVPGSTPVYSYYQILPDDSQSFTYTTSSDPPAGFTFYKIAFWAYTSEVADSQPIYEHYAVNRNGTMRYLYSDESIGTNGWTYKNLAFYVPAN